MYRTQFLAEINALVAEFMANRAVAVATALFEPAENDLDVLDLVDATLVDLTEEDATAPASGELSVIASSSGSSARPVRG